MGFPADCEVFVEQPNFSINEQEVQSIKCPYSEKEDYEKKSTITSLEISNLDSIN